MSGEMADGEIVLFSTDDKKNSNCESDERMETYMKEELQNKLAEKFPFMQRKQSLEEQKANGRIHDLYGAFGCDVGDGWYSVLYGLCEEITVTYEKAGVPINIKPAQVKEKFGSLRFYYDVEGQEKSIHAFDFLGQGGLRFTPNDTSLHKEISSIVRKYEEKSKTVCEVCGAQGELRKDLPWILTLCDECYQKRIEKMNCK